MNAEIEDAELPRSMRNVLSARQATLMDAEIVELYEKAAAFVEDAEARAKMAMCYNAEETRKLLDRAYALLNEIETLKGNN